MLRIFWSKKVLIHCIQYVAEFIAVFLGECRLCRDHVCLVADKVLWQGGQKILAMRCTTDWRQSMHAGITLQLL